MFNFISSYKYAQAAAFFPKFTEEESASFLIWDTFFLCVFAIDFALYFFIEVEVNQD